VHYIQITKMAKWTRISLSLLTILTAVLIILGALLPTFVAKSGPQQTYGLFKTCVPRDSNNHGGISGNKNADNFDSAVGLICTDNDKYDKVGSISNSARETANNAAQKAGEFFGNEKKINHTYKPRPTAEKVSAGFLCTAGVLTALIGLFTLFPSLNIFAFTYMISPVVLHVIGMSLAIWTGMERYKSYSLGQSRSVGAGLALQIVSLISLIVLSALWSMPSARKQVVTKYGA